MKIQDILLMQDVKRWIIVRTSVQQSNAEHTFNVTMIARAIAKEANMPDERIAKYALDHDLDEVMTGDMPSPSKIKLGLKGKGYEGSSKSLCSAEEVLIVEVADIMEAVIFISENGLGRHGQLVSQKLTKKFIEKLQFVDGLYPHIGTASQAVWDSITSGEYDIEKYI